MKFACLSDVHLLWDNPISRLDNLRQVQFEKLEFVLQWCMDNDAVLLQAGDFFNRPRSWYLLPETMELLTKYEIKIYSIFGQHDTYFYNEKTRASTSLGILEKAGLVTILSSEVCFEKGRVGIYGASYGQQLPVPEHKGVNIGVIHAPIADRAVYPGQNYVDSLTYLKENEGYDLILCGDIHQKFIHSFKGRYIVNSGPMLRKEATAYNFQHHPGFFCFDVTSSKAPEWIEISHAPAEQVLSRAHIDMETEENTILDEFIGLITDSDLSLEANFIDNLWLFVRKNKIENPVVDLLSEVING